MLIFALLALSASGQNWSSRVVASFALDPNSVQTADADGDGDLDVLVADGDRGVLWLLQQDDGYFTERFVADPGTSPREAVPVDLDCDGDLDVAWSVRNGAPLGGHVAYDLGDLQYGHLVDLSSSDSLAIGEVDLGADGDPDLVIGHERDLGFSLFENTSAGVLERNQVPTDHPAGAVRGGDLDGDGQADLVVLSDEGNLLSVAWNEEGELQLDDVAELWGASDAAVADLDGDGDLDVAAVGVRAAEVVVLDNLGDRTFELQRVPVEDGAEAVAAAQLDGGGPLEVVVIYPAGELVVVEHLVDGWSAQVATEVPRARDVSVGDVDGDGDGDLVVAAEDVLLLRYHWASGFTSEVIAPAHVAYDDLAAGDLDGDGDLDLVLVSIDSAGPVWIENRGLAGFVRRDLGSGRADHVALGDLDDDGDLDVVTASSVDDLVTVHVNDGTGTFPADQSEPFVVGEPGALATGDVDGDGDLDVVGLGGAGSVIGWIEQGELELVADPVVSFGVADGRDLALADLNDDGHLDAVITEMSGGLGLWAGDGTGAFTRAPIDDDFEADGVAVGDLDGDGDPDVAAVGAWADRVVWYANDGAGGFSAAGELLEVEAPWGLDLGDRDGDGDLDVLVVTDDRARKELLWLVQDATGGYTVEPVGHLEGVEGPVLAADTSGDGLPEVLAIADRGREVRVFRDCGAVDSDGDGIFDGCDAAPDDDGWTEASCSATAPPDPQAASGGGCGCAASPRGAGAWLVLPALVGLLRSRSRRR